MSSQPVPDNALIAADQLRRFVTSAAEALGLPPDDARIAADQMLWAEASPGKCHNLRLCFTYSTPEQIEEGVRRLGRAIRRLHNRSGQSPGTASERKLREHFD